MNLKKSANAKNIFQLSKKLRSSQASKNGDRTNLDDSLDKIIPQSIKPRKNSHSRSNSCPFIKSEKYYEKVLVPPRLKIQIQQQATVKSFKKPLKKKTITHKQSNSQISQSTHTVIVHNTPVQQISSLLYLRNQQTPKKAWGTGRDKKMQSDVYFLTKLQQQIKMYELNDDLQKVQKQSCDISIKQNVLQSLARKYDLDLADVNDSFFCQ